MKALIVFGAIVGFVTGAAFGLAGSSPWPTALWRASVAALGVGILTKWWSRIWLQNLRDSLEQRHRSRYQPTKPPTKP